jgi:hypothetical protein
MAPPKSPQRVVYRSSVDGQFTTKKEADRAPRSHQREHVPLPTQPKKGGKP